MNDFMRILLDPRPCWWRGSCRFTCYRRNSNFSSCRGNDASRCQYEQSFLLLQPSSINVVIETAQTPDEIDTLSDQHYKSREKLAWEFATILNEEARELEAAGVDVIQFDEPAFTVFHDEVQDWGVAALERAAEGLRVETAVHICYGYGIEANNTWKETLGAEWRQYEQ